jgi:hypothetical protein
MEYELFDVIYCGTFAQSKNCEARETAVKQTMEQCPLLGTRFLILQQLDYNIRRAVFSMWSVLSRYKRDEVARVLSRKLGCEEKIGKLV